MKIDFNKTIKHLSYHQKRMQRERTGTQYELVARAVIWIAFFICAFGIILGR